MEQGQRRLPVQYAKRMIGRRMYGGTSTYIPLKVNQAGVIPVIFACSLLYIPALVVPRCSGTRPNRRGLGGAMDRPLRGARPRLPRSNMLAFFVLIVGFTYFYVSGSTFNPDRSRRQT